MANVEGEVGAVKAAEALNVPFTLSSYSNCSLEEVKQAGPESTVFLQLYLFQDRNVSKRLVQRAQKAGFKAVLITVDTPVLGKRPYLIKTNFQLDRGLKYGNFPELKNLSSPITLINDKLSAGKDPAQSINGNELDASLTWDDIKWIRDITHQSNMEVWLKGVLSPEDAELAVDYGVDGIWVSNHGGRQLDSALGTMDILPDIASAVKERSKKYPNRPKMQVHLDGGVRTGNDIFKALCLGADFVWIGRPVVYGLSYGGASGVEKVLTILRDELRITMQLAGCQRVEDLDSSYLLRKVPKYSKI